MAKVNPYYTKTHEKKAVYHDKDNCPEGDHIKPQNRAEGDIGNRSLCVSCARLEHGYGNYTQWLETNGKTANDNLTAKQAELNGYFDDLAACKQRVAQYEADNKKLAALLAQRQELSSKGTLTPEETALLAALKKDYNDLYESQQARAGDYNKARDRVVFLQGGNDKDHGKIGRTQAELAVAQSEADQITAAATKLAKAHEAALKGPHADQVEVLADVVMNEARGEDPYIKKCLAYAYMNLTHNVPRAPVPADKIGYFTRSELRFYDPKEGDPKKYICNVADSLDAVRERLNDPNYATTDPSLGANRWASPKNMSKDVRRQYDSKTGIYEWLNRAKKIPVPIPEETFTFYKVED